MRAGAEWKGKGMLHCDVAMSDDLTRRRSASDHRICLIAPHRLSTPSKTGYKGSSRGKSKWVGWDDLYLSFYQPLVLFLKC
jgi:hypothetical protein